jgi:hypothetical protein
MVLGGLRSGVDLKQSDRFGKRGEGPGLFQNIF